MTDPYAAAPEPPAAAPRGCGGALLVLAFAVVGFVAVGALLFLRAPDPPATTTTAMPDLEVVDPEGFVRMPDEESGGGTIAVERARARLRGTGLAGYRAGVLRAWRNQGSEVRAVVTLALEFRAAEDARTALREHRAEVTRVGATEFAVAAVPGAFGYLDTDERGRFAQRVAFAEGDAVVVVSLLTPARDTDTAYVTALAARQAAALR